MNLVYGFCVLMAISRGLDLLSTWLVTPRLKLEANLAMKKLKWPTIFLINLPLVGLPFVHLGLSLTMIVLSLLVAGNTLSNAALTRGMGEKNHLRSIKQAVRGSSLSRALLLNSLGGMSCMGAGVILMAVSDKPWEDLVWWGALGIVAYGLTALIHVNRSLYHVFRKSKVFREASDWEDAPTTLRLSLSPEQHRQIQAKARLFGKSVEEFCQIAILDSKMKVK